MNAAVPRQDQLFARLLELARGDALVACMCVRAGHSHQISAFGVEAALLAIPVQGCKRVREGADWIDIHPGNVLLVPGPRTVDLQHTPDAGSGEYVAVGISIHESLLDMARQLIPERARSGEGAVARLSLADLQEPLLRWCDAVQTGRMPMACHAMLGMVLQLYEMGHHGLLEQPAPRLATRIRSMVAANPGREWASSDIEAELGMSGASVRRHLAAEGASLRDIIVDARLAHALQLLYTTRLPVKSVAQRVGYASVASFGKRFAERYGVEPSRIGNAQSIALG